MDQSRKPDQNGSDSGAQPGEQCRQPSQKPPATKSRVFEVLQIIAFAFGIVVSGFAVALPALDLGKNLANSFLLFPALSVGFALILASLGFARSDKSTSASIAGISTEGQIQLPDKGQKLRRLKSSKPEESLPVALASVRRRITEHINRLTRFALGNIVIGSIVAGAGVLVIFNLFTRILDIQYGELAAADSGHYLSFFFIVFLPRISIVILIQVFAYFFLSMYRANLREIRYFQIELNDIDLLGEAIDMTWVEDLTPYQAQLVERLFAMVKYRGDSFRAGLSTDEAIETFQALSSQGNILDRITPLLTPKIRSQPVVSKSKRKRKSISKPSQSSVGG